MADDSELDYLRTFFEAIHKGTYIFADVVASVNTGTKAVTLTTNGATLNQYTDYCLYVVSGDNADDEYTVVSCTAATPTVLTVSETITDKFTSAINNSIAVLQADAEAALDAAAAQERYNRAKQGATGP